MFWNYKLAEPGLGNFAAYALLSGAGPETEQSSEEKRSTAKGDHNKISFFRDKEN